MMAQFSEYAGLFEIFTDLFDPEGAEIYFKPVCDYVAVEEPVNFYMVVEAARQRGETAIGYRKLSEANEAGKSNGVHTNPLKSALIQFAPEDKIIQISES